MPLILLKTLKNTSFIIFFQKIILSRKTMYFFWFSSTNKWKYENNLKRHFLGRIFLFIQIAYIILVKRGFVYNAINTPKNVEKHVIYDFFQKKSILWQYSVFFVYFLWKQWNKQKIIEKFNFSVKRNFFREMACIYSFFLN